MSKQSDAEFWRDISASMGPPAPIHSQIITELQSLGIDVQDVMELGRDGRKYVDAIPVLLKWLPMARAEPEAWNACVRKLSVPFAGRAAFAALVRQFEEVSNALFDHWAVGNGIGILARQGDLDTLLRLCCDVRFGRSREMIVMALGRFRAAAAIQTLVHLLRDDDVMAHAVIALGKLRTPSAIEHLEPLLSHERSLVRKEAAKALARIRAAQGQASSTGDSGGGGLRTGASPPDLSRPAGRLAVPKARRKKSTQPLEESVAILARFGLELNPGVMLDDLQRLWSREDYERGGLDLLLHAYGSELEWEPLGRRVCERAWVLDLECIGGDGSYVELVEQLCRVAGMSRLMIDALDSVEDESDGDGNWIDYTIDGVRGRVPIVVDDDWADPDALRRIMRDIERDGKRFYGIEDGQQLSVIYLDQRSAEGLDELVRGRLKALTA